MSDPPRGRRPRSSEAGGSMIPPAQRTRTDVHLKGGILRIKLHNFLTFDDVTVCPSPGLNVVLGPNGTGKSSIVCAICLGLAGNPSLLGRAREIKCFVKHGKRSGYVELDLSNGESARPVTIRRTITAENNRSEWTLNGVTAKEQQISEVVKQFNIQLGNHCQFLPQDMVVKFAAMNPYDLLEASEKAIGRSNMYEDHQKLKTFSRDIASLENSLQQRKANHVDLKQKNDLISTDVERFRNRENFLREVECLKKKKYWMDYQEARVAFAQCKAERRQKDLELKNLKDRLKPYEDEKRQKEEAVEECRSRVVSLRKRQTSLAHQVAQHRGKLQELEDQVDQPRQELKEKKKEEERRLKRLEDLQKEIDGFERELSGIDEEIAQSQSEGSDGPNARLKEIYLNLLELKSSAEKHFEAMAQLEFERDALVAQLRRKKEETDRRLQFLQQRNRDTYKAIMWLRENQHRFEYPIIEPILLVTNCKSRQYMPQVESVIRGRDMFSFVARSMQDMHLFMTEVHDKMNLRVNGVTAPNKPVEAFTPDQPFEQLRRHHFRCMLLDHIDAPPPVLSYLCHKHNVHNIPVAGELTPVQIEEFERCLPQSVKFLRYFTESSEFSVQRSRFAGHMISRSKEIRRPEFMMFEVNQDDTEGLEAEIKAKDSEIKRHQREVDQLMGKEKVLRQEDAELKRIKSQIQAKRGQKRSLNSIIQSRKAKMEQLSNSAIDLEAEEQRCMAEVVTIQKKRVSAVKKLAELLTEYVHMCESLAAGVVQQTQSSLERDVLVKRCRESEEELKHMESVCTDLKNKETGLKEAAVELLHKARKATGVKEPDDLPLELKQKFDTYPNTLVEIDEMMHEYQVKADLCAGIDPRVVNEYKSREKDIDQLGREIQRMEVEVDQQSSELETIKKTWLEPLRELVASVNEKFSYYFSQMGCAGQVRLNEHDTDFSLYGVEIMVKFRDSEVLQLLTSTRQSGGERSVSTMLYLLALQDLTNCPFRAVDEINQGMDPVNERKVFNLIVDAVSGPSTAQYFLFTPKLLHSLNFTNNVTVLLINNGPEMLDFRENQVEIFLQNEPYSL